jgi:hypothetical protein
VSDKCEQGEASAIEPTAITAFRTTPLPGAWNRNETYGVETADGCTIEISLAEWRALLNEALRLTGRHLIHRHHGADMAKGLFIEVVQ